MVTHLKKAVIVVCFWTLETMLEAWATAGGMGHSSRMCCPSSISTHINDMLIRIKLVLLQRAQANNLTVTPRIS